MSSHSADPLLAESVDTYSWDSDSGDLEAFNPTGILKKFAVDSDEGNEFDESFSLGIFSSETSSHLDDPEQEQSRPDEMHELVEEAIRKQARSNSDEMHEPIDEDGQANIYLPVVVQQINTMKYVENSVHNSYVPTIICWHDTWAPFFEETKANAFPYRVSFSFYITNQLDYSAKLHQVIQGGILHELMLLDLVARIISNDLLESKHFGLQHLTSLTTKFKALFVGKVIAMVSLEESCAQYDMLDHIFKSIKHRVNTIRGTSQFKFLNDDHDSGKWWAIVCNVLRTEARDFSHTHPNLNLVLGYYLTLHANNTTEEMFSKKQYFDIVEAHFAEHGPLITPVSAIGIGSNGARSDVRVVEIKRGKKRKHLTVGRDIAYCYLLALGRFASLESMHDLCQPGMPLGIYPDGAGPPSILAQSIVIVTADPSILEAPPYSSEKINSASRGYVYIAFGMLGRVPLRLEEHVLKRFAAHTNGCQLFWMKCADCIERVDFASEGHPINYFEAIYIGDAEFDSGCFNGAGDLVEEFQGVRGLAVIVSYGAVSMTQVKGMVHSLRQDVDTVGRTVAHVNHQLRQMMLLVLVLMMGFGAWVLMSHPSTVYVFTGLASNCTTSHDPSMVHPTSATSTADIVGVQTYLRTQNLPVPMGTTTSSLLSTSANLRTLVRSNDRVSDGSTLKEFTELHTENEKNKKTEQLGQHLRGGLTSHFNRNISTPVKLESFKYPEFVTVHTLEDGTVVTIKRTETGTDRTNYFMHIKYGTQQKKQGAVVEHTTQKVVEKGADDDDGASAEHAAQETAQQLGSAALRHFLGMKPITYAADL